MSSRLVLCTKLLLLYNFWCSGWLDVIWCPVRVWIAGRLLGWTPDPKVSEPFWTQGESPLTQCCVFSWIPEPKESLPNWTSDPKVSLPQSIPRWSPEPQKKVSLPRLRADPKLSLFRWTPDPKVSLPRCSPNPKVSLPNPRQSVGRWATILL